MSRIFEHPNMLNFACPICGTQEDKRVVLVPIQGTREGVMVECEQVHLDCLLNGLMYYKQRSVMALLCSYGENPDCTETKKYLQKKQANKEDKDMAEKSIKKVTWYQCPSCGSKYTRRCKCDCGSKRPVKKIDINR